MTNQELVILSVITLDVFARVEGKNEFYEHLKYTGIPCFQAAVD